MSSSPPWPIAAGRRLDALVKKIARALLDLPAPVLRDLPVPAAERTRSIGNYDDGMFKFKVYQQGEQLYVEFRPSVHRCGFAIRVRTNSRRRNQARAASGSSRPTVPLSASTGNGLNCGRSGAVRSEGAARPCFVVLMGLYLQVYGCGHNLDRSSRLIDRRLTTFSGNVREWLGEAHHVWDRSDGAARRHRDGDRGD